MSEEYDPHESCRREIERNYDAAFERQRVVGVYQQRHNGEFDKLTILRTERSPAGVIVIVQ